VDAWRSPLGSADRTALVESDLIPFQAADFACSHPVTIRDQDHGGIAVTVPVALGGFDQPLDLALGEVAAFNCEVLVFGALVSAA
jgi:hypothetical protein